MLIPATVEKKMPPEVYGMICSYACRDWGCTGRSLSAVSKYTRDISAPYKFQSISLINLFEIVSFTSVLQQTPQDARRVRYLFLSDSPQSTDPRWHNHDIEDSYLRRKAGASKAVMDVLELVASTVETIHGLFIWPHTFCLLPSSLDFSALTELALYHHYRSKPDEKAVYPQLRDLRLISCPSLHKADFKWITQLAPGLTHLYVSAAHPYYDMLFQDFAKTIEKVLSEDLLPEDVQLLIELPDLEESDMNNEHRAYIGHLQRLATKFSRMSLVESPADIATSDDAERQWLNSVSR